MLQQFCSKVWPNGEFGLSCSRKIEIGSSEIPPRSARQVEDAEWMLNALKVHGAEAVLSYLGFDPFESTPLPISHRRKKRGLRGITSHGKRLVRNAAFILESENPISNLTFATFTLPNVSRRESITISRHWAEVVRVFLQKLKRLLQSRGLPGEIVGVTEVQSERTFRDGILGLHLHLVFVGRLSKKTWSVRPVEFKEAWKSVVSGYLSSGAESYDWRACENIVRVKYSVEQYLGKYLSKGVDTLPAVAAEFGEDFLPSAWYSCSAALRERVLRSVKTLSDDAVRRLIDSCCDAGSVKFVYRRPVQLESDGGKPVTIGWFGKIRREYIREFAGEDRRNDDRNWSGDTWGNTGVNSVDRLVYTEV